MKPIPLLVWAVSLYCLTACTKEKTKPAPPSYLTEMEGRVIRHGTNHAPTDSPIMLVLYESTYIGVFGADYRVIDTIYTDSAGYYKYSFNANPKKNGLIDYYIIPKTVVSQHFPLTDEQYSSNRKYLKIGQNHQIDWSYYPYAWLRLHTKNINPQVNDRLRIDWGQGEFTILGPVERENILLAAGGSNQIGCWLTRNDSIFNLSFSVIIPAFDTTYFYLEY